MEMATKAMGGLFKKRFLTKDARGCEFWVLALYDEPEYRNGAFSRHVRYMAHGFSSESLRELKRLVANA